MAKSNITIKNKFILDNLGVLNKNMGGIIGRVVDPPLKKYMRSFMQTTSGMKKYPGSVARPIEWEDPHGDDRQRKAFFARDGFGGGIPHRRTGEFFRAFDVLSNRRDGWVKIFNTADFAKYIIGDRQQKFHKNTGYRKLESYEPEALKGAIPVASRALESEIFRFLTKRGLI